MRHESDARTDFATIVECPPEQFERKARRADGPDALQPGEIFDTFACDGRQVLLSRFLKRCKLLFDEGQTFALAQQFLRNETQRQKETAQVGKLLLLYVDEALDDTLPFGSVRRQAFSIMPKAALQQTGQRLTRKPVSSDGAALAGHRRARRSGPRAAAAAGDGA